SAQSWDALRNAHPHFALPSERAAWLASLSAAKDGQDRHLQRRAAVLASWLQTHHIREVHSCAVGTAALEFHLKRCYPSLRLVISEFAPNTVERLRRVFIECDEVLYFDLTDPHWHATSAPSQSLLLLYRADPHLSDTQWTTTFARLAFAGHRNLLFVPAHLLSFPYYAYLQVSWALA